MRFLFHLCFPSSNFERLLLRRRKIRIRRRKRRKKGHFWGKKTSQGGRRERRSIAKNPAQNPAVYSPAGWFRGSRQSILVDSSGEKKKINIQLNPAPLILSLFSNFGGTILRLVVSRLVLCPLHLIAVLKGSPPAPKTFRQTLAKSRRTGSFILYIYFPPEFFYQISSIVDAASPNLRPMILTDGKLTLCDRFLF